MPYKVTLLYGTLLAALQLFSNSASAQIKREHIDPSGYITKYDTSFNGIGPTVYLLPHPRTKAELMTDSYLEIESFQDSIDHYFQFKRLLAAFKKTTNDDIVEKLLIVEPKNDEDWQALIDSVKATGNTKTAASLSNEYARKSIIQGNPNKAVALLKDALQSIEKLDNPAEKNIIQSNLSAVSFYNKNFIEAGRYEEQYYQTSVKDKSIVDQGKSLVRIALIQAYDKDYKSAENTIIRKAIPLFNRAKDYEQKVKAWIALSEIYQRQNKHTEAQWFLIQARDLAESKKFSNELAEIEYMLGYSKYIQKNFAISKKELQKALELAQKEENKILELAALEKIGQISLKQNNIAEAESLLNQYWKIRSDLF